MDQIMGTTIATQLETTVEVTTMHLQPAHHKMEFKIPMYSLSHQMYFQNQPMTTSIQLCPMLMRVKVWILTKVLCNHQAQLVVIQTPIGMSMREFI